ncbi:MAG: archaeal proteasome endopeptidase complex subunit alpha [Candidatus Aenigmarchaeota archaeon]|nr:archaeal proteasome endopeptidase complex subunit alpha [Candidatus Aenigmarchaeota archaeon]
MPNPMKMGFDRSIVVFSPEGRMYQVEYARKAVENLSTTTVGVVFNHGVVFAAARQTAKLLVTDTNEKISKIDNHIGIASCGILSDCRVLIDYARVRSQINRITFGEPIEINALVKDIADRKQKFTQIGGIRPYGVSFLIGGADGTQRLYETDPSGTVREWKAHAIGRGFKEARKYLVDNYKENLTKEAAIDLALNALKTGEKKLSSDGVEIGLVENDKFRILTKQEIKTTIKEYL